ncbi:MAG: thioredoxin family protein [Myxococcales bacterium]|nr:thioredoxin family protein [Myxococcales bacterium]
MPSTSSANPAMSPRSSARAAALLLALAACNAEIPVADDDLPATPGKSAAAPPAAPATTPAPAAGRVATAPANGYGDRIAWRGLDEGLQEAAATNRPLMLVVHAAWCPRCKELKRRFFDPTLADASERFVMVNLDQDAQPDGLRYGPDGTYIPRVLFLDAHGQVDHGLSNPGRSKYKYFYSHRDDLVSVMQTALARHGTH